MRHVMMNLPFVCLLAIVAAADTSECAASSDSSTCAEKSTDCGCGSKLNRGSEPAPDAAADPSTAAPTPPIPEASSKPPRLLLVEGGTFTMGHSNRSISPSTFDVDGEGPARHVKIRSFWLGETEVSNAQWAAFAAASGHKTDSERFKWSFVFEGQLTPAANESASQSVQDAPWWVKVDGADWRHPDGPGSDALEKRSDHPVVHISWFDAQAYCKWAHPPHGRLPTEAEWEYAARGGEHAPKSKKKRQNKYPWGNVLVPNGEHKANVWQGVFPKSNTADDGYAATAPIFAYGPQNALGLYNVIGNVWEWVDDYWITSHERRKASDPPLDALEISARAMTTRKSNERTKKGGSYMCHKSYCHRYRVQARSQNSPDSATGNLGFRCSAPGGDKPQELDLGSLPVKREL